MEATARRGNTQAHYARPTEDEEEPLQQHPMVLPDNAESRVGLHAGRVKRSSRHTLRADHVGLRCPVSAGNLSSIHPRTRSVRNSVK
jgi:hypothetical protein